jgi:hypothetical protein
VPHEIATMSEWLCIATHKEYIMQRSSKTVRLTILLALIVAMFPAGMAFAQDQTVNTGATIDPAGTPPVVHYKFEVPDADSAAPGIQYNSDDATLFQPGAQIAPNLENLPEVQQIAYWWIAEDPNGIGDVIDGFVRVFHPDGTMKYQVHDPNGPNACSDLGTWNTPGTPLYAAYRSGQLTSAQADSIVENCNKNVWRPYFVSAEINKHQPCGAYRVVASVVDQAGNVGSLENTMDILCIIGLEIDFASVNFGQILPNTDKWVRGDMTFGAGTLPSVKNTGNSNLFLQLQYSNMLGANFQKVINRFDAKLNAQTIDPMAAGTSYCFNLEPLGSNEVGQLDLSIHPGSIPADTYSGTLRLWGLAGCP